MIALKIKNFSPEGLGRIATEVLPTIATVVLIVVISSTFASLTWQMLPSVPGVPAPKFITAIDKRLNTSRTASTSQAFDQIPNWHLFGMVQKNVPGPVEQVPVAPKEAPDTQLRLTLKGVVAAGDMADAWAIIADRVGNEDSYHTESSLPGGAILKEIYVDRIILMHNGRLETLRLPTTDLAGTRDNTRSNTRANRRNSRSNRNTRNARSSRLNSSNINRVSSAGSAVLKNYRDKLLNDPQSVMNTVRAEPYRQAGRLKGYRIFPGRDKNLFGELGLEPGDVVTSVNGIALDSPLKGLEVMQNVTDASEISVEVLRNGVNQTFVVPMN